VKIGVVFPQTEIGNDPLLLKEYVQSAEHLGYTHILAYEHVLGANPERPGGWTGPYTYKHPFHEPFVLFGWMAAFTSKIEFVTGILVLPQRQTAVVAKQATELANLSNGRLRLGVGIGWNQVEYLALGQDFYTRGKRIEEQVEVLRRLWSNELVEYKGIWHTIPDAGLNPLPKHEIPIWFGGHHQNVLYRIGTIGNGWMPNYYTAQSAKPSIETIHKHATEAKRSPSDIGIEARIRYGDGDATRWQKEIEDWREVRATHISVNTMGVGLSPPEHLQAIQTFSQTLEMSTTTH
jgi:probable F420-dependent oxidoreductase